MSGDVNAMMTHMINGAHPDEPIALTHDDGTLFSQFPLEMALMHHPELVHPLLAAGADPTLRSLPHHGSELLGQPSIWIDALLFTSRTRYDSGILDLADEDGEAYVACIHRAVELRGPLAVTERVMWQSQDRTWFITPLDIGVYNVLPSPARTAIVCALTEHGAELWQGAYCDGPCDPDPRIQEALTRASRERVTARTAIFKEELMKTAWHPARCSYWETCI